MYAASIPGWPLSLSPSSRCNYYSNKDITESINESFLYDNICFAASIAMLMESHKWYQSDSLRVGM